MRGRTGEPSNVEAATVPWSWHYVSLFLHTRCSNASGGGRHHLRGVLVLVRCLDVPRPSDQSFFPVGGGLSSEIASTRVTASTR
jgi:hypothetical protein